MIDEKAVVTDKKQEEKKEVEVITTRKKSSHIPPPGPHPPQPRAVSGNTPPKPPPPSPPRPPPRPSTRPPTAGARALRWGAHHARQGCWRCSRGWKAQGWDLRGEVRLGGVGRKDGREGERGGSGGLEPFRIGGTGVEGGERTRIRRGEDIWGGGWWGIGLKR